ncbi:hypothetical protein TNCT_456101 [Trichonephila clavata]|uniref:Uncharacterized protein n=1 Tax=Trichonephila clavata TaxID=2740835 RepID=A0A8X6L351_TRICU|nr:hypothetical protein TNCT_456101 [Trichonephila clavata]
MGANDSEFSKPHDQPRLPTLFSVNRGLLNEQATNCRHSMVLSLSHGYQLVLGSKEPRTGFALSVAKSNHSSSNITIL